MRLNKCGALAAGPVQGTWYRAIQLNHWRTLLSVAHTATVASRFSSGSPARPVHPILYLAEDPVVAMFETGALLGSPLPGRSYLPAPNSHWISISLRIRLTLVVDLTLPGERRMIGTTAQELTGDWQ